MNANISKADFAIYKKSTRTTTKWPVEYIVKDFEVRLKK